jgi:hypothetical protein
VTPDLAVRGEARQGERGHHTGGVRALSIQAIPTPLVLSNGKVIAGQTSAAPAAKHRS